ncbi:MAG: dihydrodipicolinate reductase [Desulfobacterium sp.]|nr:dihydrodipicolinate reductase [Desulfobacterium sp.]
MKKIYLMINGIPGKVALTIAAHTINDDRFTLVPFSLTGPDIEEEEHTVDGHRIRLIRPEERNDLIKEICRQYPGFISIDYTHPTAVNDNARFYVKNKLAFVMGTTGGDRAALMDTVRSGSVPALIAPNMAKQIVGFQAMMEYAGKTFPGLFKGYTLTVEESHQNGKADTSGTARVMVGCFNDLGIPFSDGEIEMVRDPGIQRDVWKIPEEHLTGHAWHTYTLTSKDGSASFQFKHNINGREIYIQGTLDGALFLNDRLNDLADNNQTDKTQSHKTPARIYTMIDVLRTADGIS